MEKYYITDEELENLREASHRLNVGEIKEGHVTRDVEEGKTPIINAYFVEKNDPNMIDIQVKLRRGYRLIRDFVSKCYKELGLEIERLSTTEDNLDMIGATVGGEIVHTSSISGLPFIYMPDRKTQKKVKRFIFPADKNNVYLAKSLNKDETLFSFDGDDTVYTVDLHGNLVEAPNIDFISFHR